MVDSKNAEESRPIRPEKIAAQKDSDKCSPTGDIKSPKGGENVKGDGGRICGGNI